MFNVRKCRKYFCDSNVPANFLKFFLRPDSDSAHVNVPYRSNFGSKFENFVPPLISKGVPLLGDFREF